MTLQELEGFTHGMALDLNMGYYIIRLDAHASKMCTTIFPVEAMGNCHNIKAFSRS
jgi:hypothetical protein